jgi:hypothetical protein
MKIKFFFGAALLLVPLLATPVMALAQTSSALAQARTNETLAPSRTYEM